MIKQQMERPEDEMEEQPQEEQMEHGSGEETPDEGEEHGEEQGEGGAQQAGPSPFEGGSPEGMRVVMAAGKIIYGKSADKIVKMLRGGRDPVSSLMMTTAFIIKTVISKSRGMPPQAMIEAAPRVVDMLVELGNAAGIRYDPQQVNRVKQMTDGAVKKYLSKAQQAGARRQQPPPQGGRPQGPPAQGAPQPQQAPQQPARPAGGPGLIQRGMA